MKVDERENLTKVVLSKAPAGPGGKVSKTNISIERLDGYKNVSEYLRRENSNQPNKPPSSKRTQTCTDVYSCDVLPGLRIPAEGTNSALCWRKLHRPLFGPDIC